MRMAISLRAPGVRGCGICAIDRFQHGEVAAELFPCLDAMSIPKSPFANKLSTEDARGVRYVRPELVAEVEFRT